MKVKVKVLLVRPIMSSNTSPGATQSLHLAVGRFAVAANQAFELFRTYSNRSSDSSLDRNELCIAARQTKKRCDDLLHDARLTLRGATQKQLDISEELERFANLFETYSRNEPLRLDIFLELRVRVGRVRAIH